MNIDEIAEHKLDALTFDLLEACKLAKELLDALHLEAYGVARILTVPERAAILTVKKRLLFVIDNAMR